jgi:hypothetical protein
VPPALELGGGEAGVVELGGAPPGWGGDSLGTGSAVGSAGFVVGTGGLTGAGGGALVADGGSWVVSLVTSVTCVADGSAGLPGWAATGTGTAEGVVEAAGGTAVAATGVLAALVSLPASARCEDAAAIRRCAAIPALIGWASWRTTAGSLA